MAESKIKKPFQRLITIDKELSNIQIASLDTFEAYYTINELETYDVIAVTPTSLGDSRYSFRGWYVNRQLPLRLYVLIANPSASTGNGKISFKILLMSKS